MLRCWCLAGVFFFFGLSAGDAVPPGVDAGKQSPPVDADIFNPKAPQYTLWFSGAVASIARETIKATHDGRAHSYEQFTIEIALTPKTELDAKSLTAATTRKQYQLKLTETAVRTVLNGKPVALATLRQGDRVTYYKNAVAFEKGGRPLLMITAQAKTPDGKTPAPVPAFDLNSLTRIYVFRTPGKPMVFAQKGYPAEGIFLEKNADGACTLSVFRNVGTFAGDKATLNADAWKTMVDLLTKENLATWTPKPAKERHADHGEHAFALTASKGTPVQRLWTRPLENKAAPEKLFKAMAALAQKHTTKVKLHYLTP